MKTPLLQKNHCGFDGMKWRPPLWKNHNLSCYRHDRDYEIGGTEAERLKFDRFFLQSMLKNARHIKNPIERAAAMTSAWAYYYAVRALGSLSFQYQAN